VSEKKSDKELAFLKDLYVATDWGERFAELFDENVELPTKGRILYVETGSGDHAMALHTRTEDDVTMVCLDESEESLELARAKAVALNVEPEFRRAKVDELDLRDNQFEMVVGDGSLIAHDRLRKMLSELVRVAARGGTVGFMLPTAGSFGEFFSIYWEALRNAGFEELASVAEKLIAESPTVSVIEESAKEAGLKSITSQTRPETFTYESGEEFLSSPLITDFLFPIWMQALPEEAHERVAIEVARLIDEERADADFLLSLKATLVTGKKS
jgi:ubiquinone/menaquinone biosynthesis C-methylase UbiE